MCDEAPLKGVHLAEWLYSDIGLRQFSDIDLLINKEEGKRYLQILRDMGFVQTGDEVSHMIAEQSGLIHYPAMVLKEVSVEIHIDLHHRQEPYDLDIKKIIQCAEALTINHARVHVLELYDLLIYLCIHLDKHFKGGHVQFTSFCDITNLIDVKHPDMDWQKLEIRCRMYNCEEAVYKYIYLAHKYFHARLPEAVAREYSTYLSAQDEELFMQYLNGYKAPFYGASTHLENIANIHSWWQKIRYFVLVVFPTREYMLRSYRIKYPSLFWLYYPTRHWKGLKGLWRVFRR